MGSAPESSIINHQSLVSETQSLPAPPFTHVLTAPASHPGSFSHRLRSYRTCPSSGLPAYRKHKLGIRLLLPPHIRVPLITIRRSNRLCKLETELRGSSTWSLFTEEATIHYLGPGLDDLSRMADHSTRDIDSVLHSKLLLPRTIVDITPNGNPLGA